MRKSDEYIARLNLIKTFLTNTVKEMNFEGRGEINAVEIGETMDVAIDAVKQTAWIPCSEEMPGAADHDILFFVPTFESTMWNGQHDSCSHEWIGYMEDNYPDIFQDSEVTHWMRWPKAPED